jgi:L-amino acid N-acyltransferase YncA
MISEREEDLPEIPLEPDIKPTPELEIEINPEPEIEINPEPEIEINPEPEIQSGQVSTEVFPASEINESDKTRMNQIFETAFPSVTAGTDYVGQQGGEGISVCVLRLEGQVEGAAFAVKKTMKTDPTLVSPDSYLVHSVAISPEMQGKGHCKEIMGALVKEFGDNPMYLNVRTTEGDPNKAGIKCYERNGFQLIPCIAEIKDDGPNSVMIRDPDNLKDKKSRKSHKTRKSSKTRKTRKELRKRSRARSRSRTKAARARTGKRRKGRKSRSRRSSSRFSRRYR